MPALFASIEAVYSDISTASRWLSCYFSKTLCFWTIYLKNHGCQRGTKNADIPR
jgi:hypothetical protein